MSRAYLIKTNVSGYLVLTPFSYLSNTKMSMMTNSGVSKKSLMLSVFIMYMKRLRAVASSVKQEKGKKVQMTSAK